MIELNVLVPESSRWLFDETESLSATLIMAFVFFLTFTVGDALKGYFEIGLDYVSQAARDFLVTVHTSEWLISLIVDGIIAGVGGILAFVPNIFILFLALAIL